MTLILTVIAAAVAMVSVALLVHAVLRAPDARETEAGFEALADTGVRPAVAPIAHFAPPRAQRLKLHHPAA